MTVDELAAILVASDCALQHWGASGLAKYSCQIVSRPRTLRWTEPFTLRGRGRTMAEALEDALEQLAALELGRDDLKRGG